MAAWVSDRVNVGKFYRLKPLIDEGKILKSEAALLLGVSNYKMQKLLDMEKEREVAMKKGSGVNEK